MELSQQESERRDALAGRLFEAALGAFDVLTVDLGLELGLYEALRRDGPATPGELASRAGIDARYAREWVEQQAVTGILTVDDVAAGKEARRYSLPAGHAEALLDAESPAASQSMVRFLASGGRMLTAIVDAYRTGAGVAWDAYPGIVKAQELANRPLFAHVLTSDWLPAIPDVQARLTSAEGAHIADVACGTGYSSIALARAYPHAVVEGLDVDPESIERARANARDAGFGNDHVRFHLVDAARSDLDGRFDVALIVEAVHDMADPVAVLRSVRGLLKPGGALIVADEGVQEQFTAPGDEIERAMYGYSVLFCLPNTRAEPGSVATGTVIRPEVMGRYGTEAGFAKVSVLPIAHEVFRLYRMDP
ncbi:MAG TPA: class I SAM-dependent methyltransferase [Candidatus Limnocylindria bacterium]|nr:class I SAM-dependent methyltransferase [Candidatus Limnocylindria bacterium]